MANTKRPFDMLSSLMREARKPYHVSLGTLRLLAENNPTTLFVLKDDGRGIANPHSYRGYYEDLAFAPAYGETNGAQLAHLCGQALRFEFEGYKGGMFSYDENTPLWIANWGETGVALVDVVLEDGVFFLVTKEIN